jgi:hypothetical protein
MNLLRLFHRPDDKADEIVGLVHRAVEAETQLVLLQDLIAHPRRGREIRKDAKSYRNALKATTERLHGELAASANLPLEEAIELQRAMNE